MERADLQGEWKKHLSPYFEQEKMILLREFLKAEQAKKKIIYPDHKDIFNAFTMTPFDEVKVVILGQDPYHGEGEAHGLCFSVKKGVRTPPSLLNIYKELKLEYGYPIPSHGELTSWAKQGVFLLNSVLTVEKDQAASHQKKGWEGFTDYVVSQLSTKREKLVFILWGAFAQKKGDLIDHSKHLVLTSPHPSPLSASRGFFGGNHFKLTNEYLVKNGKSPVEWKID